MIVQQKLLYLVTRHPINGIRYKGNRFMSPALVFLKNFCLLNLMASSINIMQCEAIASFSPTKKFRSKKCNCFNLHTARIMPCHFIINPQFIYVFHYVIICFFRLCFLLVLSINCPGVFCFEFNVAISCRVKLDFFSFTFIAVISSDSYSILLITRSDKTSSPKN